MNIGAAFHILIVAAAFTPSAYSSICESSVQCPCGRSGKNITVCLQEIIATSDLCSKWSGCRKCQDGLDGCLECPEGFEGSSCEKAALQKTARRLKRQFYKWQNVDALASNPVRNDAAIQNRPRWSNSSPGTYCQDIDSPKLGSIRCFSDNLQRVCTGKCLPGYTFEGHDSKSEMVLYCRDGDWAPLDHFPPCISGGHCDLVVQGAGHFNCTTGMRGTRCDVHCANRYMGRYFCYPEQPWDPPLPYCTRQKAQADSRKSCRCRNGGSCTTNGLCLCPAGWTGTVCETVATQTCHDPGFVSNGNRRNRDGTESAVSRTFDEGESVVYGCHSRDYVLQGSSTLTCGKGGTWSDPKPECKRTDRPVSRIMYCPDPGVDINGIRSPASAPSNQGFPRGSSLKYSCYGNYDLKGTKEIFCRTSGKWSASAPTCEDQSRIPGVRVVYCINPGSIKNGRFVYLQNSNSRRRPSQGRITEADPEYPEGARLQYSCDDGYVLQGSAVLECDKTGDWSKGPPTCTEVSPSGIVYCESPARIPNGQMVIHPPLQSRTRTPSPLTLEDPEYPERTRLQFQCDSGFTPVGSSSATCEASGQWSANPPVCQRESSSGTEYCKNPGYISNIRIVIHPPLQGRINRPDALTLEDPEYPVGTRLEFQCVNNSTMDGSNSATCQAAGRWSANPPVCRRVPSRRTIKYCRNPGSVMNARVLLNPTPNDRRRPDAITPEGGQFLEGSRLQYTCDAPYSLQGTQTLTCLPSGQWSAPKPTCSSGTTEEPPFVFYCENVGTIPNTRVVIYPAQGSRTRTPSPLTLEDPEYPEGTRLEFQCADGFVLVGGSSVTCTDSGFWSADPPVCRRNTTSNNGRYCNSPGLMRNGRVSYTPPPNDRGRPDNGEYVEGSLLQYTCNDGYTLDGTQTLTCTSSGLWSADKPTCLSLTPRDVVFFCDNPGPIINGRISYYPPGATSPAGRDVEDSRSLPAGTRLEYRCEDGYTLRGTFALRCEQNGVWSSSPPACTGDCGRSYMSSTRRIINGTKTLAGEWPWVVAIALPEGSGYRVQCGGALLNSRTVVTAAHCLTIASTFRLYFGKFRYWDMYDDAEVQHRTSQRVIIHPNFSNTTYDSDIGLVTFAPRIRFTERIQPICLPSADTTAKNLMTGKMGYVTGWGLNERNLNSDELMMAHLPVLTNDACMESHRSQNLQMPLTSNMICAGFENARQTACRGDSGSPLVFNDKLAKKFTLEGLVSFGVRGQCGLPGRYTVFTKVFHFAPWILRNLQ